MAQSADSIGSPLYENEISHRAVLRVCFQNFPLETICVGNNFSKSVFDYESH